MERGDTSTKFPLGSRLPEFSLPNVDGKTVSDRDLLGGECSLVVFTCNHCPYVKGSEAMLVDLVRRYSVRGLRAATISSNDAQKYPEDSPEKMKEKAREMELPYPYLYDESQKVAKLFDAACTPECYLFNREGVLSYHGAINDSPRDMRQVKRSHLEIALEQLLAGKPVEPAFVHPIGCSIKWK